MPKLSDTMTEGTVVKWNKQVGDEIEIGDVIAEIAKTAHGPTRTEMKTLNRMLTDQIA